MKIEAKVPMPKGTYIEKTSEFTGKYDREGRKVWRHKSDKHPYYLVWDEMHGEIEVFHAKLLHHVAVYHPNGDLKDKDPKEDRMLEFRK